VITVFKATASGDGFHFDRWLTFNVTTVANAAERLVEELNKMAINDEGTPDAALFVKVGEQQEAVLMEVVPASYRLERV
jgi:hypothetical protein